MAVATGNWHTAWTLYQVIFAETVTAVASAIAAASHSTRNRQAMANGFAPGTLRRHQAYAPRTAMNTREASNGQMSAL